MGLLNNFIPLEYTVMLRLWCLHHPHFENCPIFLGYDKSYANVTGSERSKSCGIHSWFELVDYFQEGEVVIGEIMRTKGNYVNAVKISGCWLFFKYKKRKSLWGELCGIQRWYSLCVYRSPFYYSPIQKDNLALSHCKVKVDFCLLLLHLKRKNKEYGGLILRSSLG